VGVEGGLAQPARIPWDSHGGAVTFDHATRDAGSLRTNGLSIRTAISQISPSLLRPLWLIRATRREMSGP